MQRGVIVVLSVAIHPAAVGNLRKSKSPPYIHIYTKGKFVTFLSFRLADAARSCECLSAFEKSQEQPGDRKCRDIKGTATSEELKEWGVTESEGWCYCWDHLFPSDGCGEVEEVKGQAKMFRSFRLAADTSPGGWKGTSCKCLRASEKAERRSGVVEAAAVRFCAQVVEKVYGSIVFDLDHMQSYLRKDLKVTPQLCQEILTGTLDDVGSPQSQALFHEANGLSKHNGTKGMGRLDPLVTGRFTASMEHQLLQHVCRDECEQIVDETLENIWKMTDDVWKDATPFEETCADRVVRKVEAEMLGCCGRSCG